MSPVGVLIADGSHVVRAVLRRIVEHGPSLSVVGEVASGRQLVEQVTVLEPDVVVMDLRLPDGDGSRAIEQILRRRPTPIVVVASAGYRGSGSVPLLNSCQGVVQVFRKPTVPAEWIELARMLRPTLRRLGERGSAVGRARSTGTVWTPRTGLRWVGVGGSTGGPGALLRMLRPFGTELPLGIAVVQHIAAGFEGAFARWLRSELDLDVRVARDGEQLAPGKVRIAAIGSHLAVDRRGRLRADDRQPPRRGHRPSIDVLFQSILDLGADRVAGVLLSGMGDDGAAGMLALRRAGALTLVQDETTSAVYGMPGAALKREAAELVLPPDAIGRLLAAGSIPGATP